MAITPPEKTGPKVGVEQIAEWLRLFIAPDQVTELRALDASIPAYRRLHIEAGFFDGAHLADMAKAALDLTRYSKSVHFVMNPLNPDLLARRVNRVAYAETGLLSADKDILCRRWLLIDADPVRIEGVSASEAEKAEAEKVIHKVRDYLRYEAGWPDPLLADSGNGFHLLYRIELPAEDGQLVKRVLQALGEQFDIDAVKIDRVVFNPARLCKLYGTWARKGDNHPTRPHRCSRILEVLQSIVPVEKTWLEEIAKQPPELPGNGKTSANNHDSALIERARKYLAKIPPAISGQRGHAQTFHAACILICEFCLSVEEALPLFREWNTGCQPPWSEKELLHKLEGAAKQPGRRGKKAQRNGKPVRPLARDQTTLPRIDASCKDLPVITQQAWDALIAANSPPTLFRHGAIPARLETDDEGSPMVRAVTADRLRYQLARVAEWFELKKADKQWVEKPTTPPLDVVRDILATPDPPLPVLLRIIETPVFAPDGSLQTEAGYCPASKSFFAPAPGFALPTVAQAPSKAEIETALTLLRTELLGDFPFVSEADRAHAHACLLCPFVRDLIEGPTPIHLIEKPTPGTGGTLLADVLTLPALGRPAPAMTEGRDEDEWRKRVFSKLRTAPSVVLIDNLRRRLESAALSSALTAYPVWEDRLLGASEMMRVPVRCTWLATGNNPALSSELTRRSVRIRIDAKIDRPWLRTSFRHADLRAWLKTNRGKVVWAALTLIRAWLQAGKPQGARTIGMFEQWAKVMGGILEVSGVPGFLEKIEEFYERADAEGEAWRRFVAAWWEQLSVRETKVAELWPLATGAGIELGDKGEHSQKIRLGKLLAEKSERVFGVKFGDETVKSLRIAPGEEANRAKQWKLEFLDLPSGRS